VDSSRQLFHALWDQSLRPFPAHGDSDWSADGFMYGPTKRLFMDLVRTNVLSIAATTGAMLEADAHESIRTRADQDTPYL
jgi:hypothetical protein